MLSLQLKLILVIQEIAKNQDLDQNKIDELKKLYEEIITFTKKRTFLNDGDLDFFKKKIW
jgi:uncharacterized protein YfkK (UPF0435 family)